MLREKAEEILNFGIKVLPVIPWKVVLSDVSNVK